MMAYRAAGITIPRTSQDQWAYGQQIPASQAQPGDLVFFAGADGTPAAPGHVGIVVNPATHTMIDAYATGYPSRGTTPTDSRRRREDCRPSSASPARDAGLIKMLLFRSDVA